MTAVIRRFRIADFSVMVAPPLDAAVSTLLKQLESQIEIPAEPVNSGTSTVRRPLQDASRGPRRERGGGRKAAADTRNIPDENWEAMRNFKATKIEVKVGIDKIINDIRSVINKINAAKLAQQQIQVIQLVRDYMESDSVSEENTQLLVKTIFDVASGNKMLAPLYSELYRELIDEFEYFKAPVDSLVNDMIMQPMIVYADPDTDYDGFCIYNKQIERRKSTTAFAVECMKADIVSDTQLIGLLNWYLDTSNGLVNTEGNEKIVEEFAEMVYIVVQQGSKLLKESAGWGDICNKIAGMSKLNAKTLPSCTNRAVFKYKDIVDLLNK